MAGGIKKFNLHPTLQAMLLPDQGSQTLNEALQAKVRTSPGNKAIANLYVPANLVNGDVITIGSTTFEVDIINTDSGVNTANTAAGALTDSQNPALVTLGTAPATAINAGDLIRIENEILKVLRKLSTTEYVCARARCGTTIAAHAQNLDVFVSDAAPASNVPIGLVTTLTPAVFAAAFVAEFTNALAGAERATAKATPAALYDSYTVHRLESGTQLLFVKNTAGADSTAVSEDFANSTDNVWGAATFVGGSAPGVKACEAQQREVTAAEELVGAMHFAFPFTVRCVFVEVYVTATGQRVFFNGQVHIAYEDVVSTDIDLPASVVSLRNVGPASTAYITPFAATHTVRVLAFE